MKERIEAMSSIFSNHPEVGNSQPEIHSSHSQALATVDAGDAELLGRLPYISMFETNIAD